MTIDRKPWMHWIDKETGYLKESAPSWAKKEFRKAFREEMEMDNIIRGNFQVVDPDEEPGEAGQTDDNPG